MPEVSVVIPSYNSAQYLPAAIDSVLAQTFQDFEIIVVDDGSTDDTSEVLARYRSLVQHIKQPNGGVSLARNRGIAEARGRYIAFLDADDTWEPSKLGRQMTELARHPDYQLCYSAFTLVDASLRPIAICRERAREKASESLLTQGNIVGSICTVICRRELFETVGGFDPKLSQCADWDMWVRLSQRTDFLYVDEPLVTYRQHDTNMSKNAPLLERDSLLVLQKGFEGPRLPANVRARRRRAFGRNYMVLAGTYYHARHYRQFLRCAALAVFLDFRQFAYLILFPRRWLAKRRAVLAPASS